MSAMRGASGLPGSGWHRPREGIGRPRAVGGDFRNRPVRRHLDEFLVERERRRRRCCCRSRRCRPRNYDFLLGAGLAVDDGHRRGIGAAVRSALPLRPARRGAAAGPHRALRRVRRVWRWIGRDLQIGRHDGHRFAAERIVRDHRPQHEYAEEQASTPTMICGTGILIERRRFFGSRPSGAVRSSTVMRESRSNPRIGPARIAPANHGGSLSRRAKAPGPAGTRTAHPVPQGQKKTGRHQAAPNP